ncbi:hypothetical protein DMUE_2201, partial [Dictyocoela muelleri]
MMNLKLMYVLNDEPKTNEHNGEPTTNKLNDEPKADGPKANELNDKPKANELNKRTSDENENLNGYQSNNAIHIEEKFALKTNRDKNKGEDNNKFEEVKVNKTYHNQNHGRTGNKETVNEKLNEKRSTNREEYIPDVKELITKFNKDIESSNKKEQLSTQERTSLNSKNEDSNEILIKETSKNTEVCNQVN